MPTYEYICDKCGHHFDLPQSIKAKPIRKCPKCGKSALKRLIGTGAAVLFKGSGFYTTDYRSENYKTGAKAEAPVKAETPPKTETTAKTTEKKETTPAPAKKESTGKKEK
jgi:putative FmdB family regulatory protein